MKPEQIQAGKSYLLSPRYATAKPIVRRVEKIEGDKVFVVVNGELKDFTLKIFADLAREEVFA